MEEKLSRREYLVLKHVVEYPDDPDNILRSPPTLADLVDYLNQQLPARRDGKPPIVSQEQVFREIRKLREKGLMIDPKQHPEIRRQARNLVPTHYGRLFLAELEYAKE